jgi:acetolactate synthase-1/2/3 large subunit
MEMSTIGAGDLLVQALVAHGVREVFALSGGHLDPIFQACVQQGVRIIDTRHEAAAVHMADGYARATGRPGVALVTAGPGVTNAVTGVAKRLHGRHPAHLHRWPQPHARR